MSLNDLSKPYEPGAVEPEVYKTWLDEESFTPDPNAPGEPYCIVIPPPNVTGALHLGHAINNTLQDILIRRARMQGKNALWIPGIDHAGIATQAVVEKQLKEKENKTRHDIGRERLVERIWQWKQQFGDRILQQLQRIGCSCDWSRTHFTLDEQCAKAVRETFFKLFKEGLIYRGKRLVNWDIALQTSISDDEIYHETVKTNLWHIHYPIIGAPHVHAGLQRPTHMTVATTRPETLLGDTAVAVHSEDPRWSWAIGMQVELPLTGRKIPIIADDILVDPKFGSGVVKVTPAHDPNDYAVWQRHQGKPDQIDLVNVLNVDGTLNENAGAYKGMKRDAARAKVVTDLEALGLLAKTEPYETQVGHSDRSKTPVEPYLSDQWFVKMAPLAEPALEVVRNRTIKFFPERHAQQYLSWLGEKRDWPISRQLWWGHRIPVWTIVMGGTQFKPGENLEEHFCKQNELADEAKQLLKDYLRAAGAVPETDLFIAPFAGRVEFVRFSVRTKLASDALDAFDKMSESYQFTLVAGNQLNVPFNHVPGFPQATKQYFALTKKIFDIIQDPDVLDTWFSSALWPHSTLGWPDDTADLRKWYPTSVLLTGRDIITLWVARMVMMGMYNMGEGTRDKAARDKGIQKEGPASSPSPGTPGEGGGEGTNPQLRTPNTELKSCPHPGPLPAYRAREKEKNLGIPFQHVAINPTILDGKGERMSKSKGNGVDPVDIIETHGADALRFTLTTMATETQDVRMPVKKMADGRNTSEKFDFGRNFCNKLWNATRFVLTSIKNLTTENAAGNNLKGTSSSVSSVNSVVDYTLADKWIISRFNRTVAEVDAAIENYRFDQYAKAVYDFFWRDFCDWYLEGAKLQLKNPETASTTGEVLAACLDGVLRLMHPVIPFITERLWWELNEVRPERGIPEFLARNSETPHIHAGLPSARLIVAPWPVVGPFDEAAEHVFPKIQDVIATIRNLKNEHQANQKIVFVYISPPGEEATRITIENKQLIEELAGCNIKEIAPDLAQPPNTLRGIANNVCDIFIEGLVDESAERVRLAKRREELVKLISGLKGRLANEAYVAKAPAHLIEQSRKQLADAEEELRKLG